MARNEMKRMALGTVVAATIAVALAGAAFAQGGPPPGPGGFGGGGFGPRPMAFGVVESVDTNAHTITLNGPQGSQTVHVSSDAKIIGEKTISASDLKVGDKIQVRGRPTTISADSIVSGDMPPMGPPPSAGRFGGGGFGGPPPGPGGFGGGGGFGGPPPGPGAFGGGGGFGPGPNSAGPPPGGPGFGPNGPGRMGNPDGMVVETGTVKSVNPLTISFNGSDRTLTVEVSGSTKVSTVGDEKLGDIKKGDRIAAQMRPQSDGSQVAERVSVNLPPPPAAMGRFEGVVFGGFQPGGRPNGGPFGQGPAGAGPGFGGGGGFGPGPGDPGFGPPPQGPGPGFGPQGGPGFGPGAPAPDGPPPAGSPDGQ